MGSVINRRHSTPYDQEGEAIQDEGCNLIEDEPSASAHEGVVPVESSEPAASSINETRSERPSEGPGSSASKQGSEQMAVKTAPEIDCISTVEIFAPLLAVPWLIEQLQIGPGRPAMLAGNAAAGKTIMVQSLALSLAAGRPVWERFAVAGPRTVVHIDYEQGKSATCRRYQRLLAGMGIEQGELGNRLDLSTYPSLNLSHSPTRLYDVFARVGERAQLVIIDSLRAATPDIDENDSRIRACIDVLSQVSSATATTFLIIHHASKPRDETSGRPGPRGSSAILDACGSAFTVTSALHDRKKIEQIKCPADGNGSPIRDLVLLFEDMDAGALRVVCEGPDSGQSGATDEGDDAGAQERSNRILEVVRRTPGINADRLRREVGGRGTSVDRVARALVDDGIIKREQIQPKGSRYWPVDHPSHSSPLEGGTKRTDSETVRDGWDGRGTDGTEPRTPSASRPERLKAS